MPKQLRARYDWAASSTMRTNALTKHPWEYYWSVSQNCILHRGNCCNTQLWSALLSNTPTFLMAKTHRILFTIRDMKSCPTADSYIDIFKNIHWVSAPKLTRTFLHCILWKIWLWTAISACRKSTCMSGRTIFLCGAERRSCSGSVQWLSSAPTSWLRSTVVFFVQFSCVQRSKIKAIHQPNETLERPLH